MKNLIFFELLYIFASVSVFPFHFHCNHQMGETVNPTRSSCCRLVILTFVRWQFMLPSFPLALSRSLSPSDCIGWQKIYENVICNLRLTPDELGALFAVAQLANWAVGRYSSEIWQIWQFRMASLVSFDGRLVPATIVIAVYNAKKIDVKILFMKIYMCELLYSFLFSTIRCLLNSKMRLNSIWHEVKAC